MVTKTRKETDQRSIPVFPEGKMYPVDNHHIWASVLGDSPSVVVFLAGAGAVGLDYHNVHIALAKTYTSIVYDRRGTGWSDPIELPRTSLEVIEELRKLLRITGLHGPYILVGHSLGGLYARHFAKIFPKDVAGLVILDPAHEDYFAFMPDELRKLWKVPSEDEKAKKTKNSGFLTKLLLALLKNGLLRAILMRLPVFKKYRKLYQDLFSKELEGWPENIRETLITCHTTPEWLLGGSMEASNVYDLYREVGSAAKMNDIPMIVLNSAEIDDFRKAVSSGQTEELFEKELEGKRKLYSEFVKTVSFGECRDIQAGHFTIHFRHPEMVLAAIQDIAEKATRNASCR